MIFTPVPFAQNITLNSNQEPVLVSVKMFTVTEQIAIPAPTFVVAPFNLTPQPLLTAIEP